MSNTWYVITEPNVNKINPFFSIIPQQIYKMFEKQAIIIQIWHKAKCYFTGMSNTWYMITVPNLNKITTVNMAMDITTNTQNVWKNCHNYSNMAYSQILFYMHKRPMVPDHGTQYEENPYSHHGGMHEDGKTDRQTDSQTARHGHKSSPRIMHFNFKQIVQNFILWNAVQLGILINILKVPGNPSGGHMINPRWLLR